MAALPGTPKTWVDGPPKVTAADMNAELHDSLAYLKGLSGQIEYDDDLEVEGLGVGTITPGARFHVYEDATTYAAIIENTRSTGMPHGLQVNSNKSGSHRVLVVGTGSIEEGIVEKFGIDADGILYSGSRELFYTPLSANFPSNYDIPDSPDIISGISLSIPRAGWWLVTLSLTITALVSPGIALAGIQAPGIPANNTPDGISGVDVWFTQFRCNAATIANSPFNVSVSRPAKITDAGTLSLWAYIFGGGDNAARIEQSGSTVSAWFLGEIV